MPGEQRAAAGPGDQATNGSEPELRRVRPHEIDALLSFAERAYGELPDKRFVYFRRRPDFEGLLAGGGCIIGAFVQDRVVGFSAFAFHPPAEEVAKLCPFVPPAERAAVAINRTTLIDQRFRRRGLASRLHTERHRMMREVGCRHSVGIVFLPNHHSLAQGLRMGRVVRGTLIDRDGPNLVTHLDLRRTPLRRPSADRAVALADFEGHRDAIADGLRGYRLEGDRDPRSLAYAPFDDDP
jgi:GNAT superfamily N-acetyltransferase